ncbi:sensor histidine kinase [Actinocorallia populi]|uniref:sensor histidine kinase n=1 Tax=Actinocorallia populi TaxID=2079200 RepID=UPI000D08B3C2|nr:histidine kinase [Actinocorallia populi]
MFGRASAVRRLNKPDRFDLHMSQTMYATAALEPFTLALWLFSGDIDGVSGELRLAVCLIWGAHTVLCLALLRRRLAALREGTVPSAREAVPMLVVTAAAVFLGLAFHVWGALPDEATARMLANAALMFAAGPLAVGWTARRAAGAYVLTALGAGLCAGLAGASLDLLLTTGLITLFSGFLIGGSFTFSAWTMKVVREIDRAREVESRLAVAEERLRFARDLHDVVMRNLSVIALKTELSIELSHRGRPDAVTQMVEVQRIARESQDEVRAVVNGYRTIDLRTELTGARSVLQAAGIACRIDGELSLNGERQTVLAWSVREGTTNVIRHSEATECSISLSGADGEVLLTMENDGVPVGRNEEPHGNGLAGIRDRLSSLGGRMEARVLSGGRFRLSVRLPADERQPTEVG